MSIHETITDRIVKQIEAGTTPWRKPWDGGQALNLRPLRSNGTPYKGVNTVILWLTAMECGYNAQHWMTFNQVKALGGRIRKGEKASEVVFFKTFDPKKTEQDIEMEEQGYTKANERRIAMLNTYKVFNVDQAEGLPEKYQVVKPPVAARISEDERLPGVDSWVAGTGATIRHGGDSAHFAPGSDHIQMPDFCRFVSHDYYYSTLLHELTHWSGAKSRLDRDLNNRFGSHKYAAEELIADLGSAFLCSDLGVVDIPRPDHAQYLAHWLTIMKADSKAIFTAAAKAEQACNYLQDLTAKLALKTA